MRNPTLCLIFAVSLHASPEIKLSQWVLDSWNMDSGLPQSTVTSIEQTRDGYLWLATRAGVVQFDGVRATLFDRSKIAGLGTNIVTNLRVDSQGQLWAAPLEPGLLRWDGARWIRVGTETGLPAREIAAMHIGPNGRLWVAPFRGGLLEWNGSSFRPVATPNPLPPSTILRLLHASDGAVWLGSAEHGLIRWLEKDWKQYDSTSGLTSDGVWAIVEPKPGTIWVGNRGGVDVFVDGKWNVSVRPPGLAGKAIETALAMPGGEIWWATFRDGLLRTTGNEVEQAQAPNALYDNQVRALFRDREGSVWIGTQGGLNRLSRPRILFFGDREGFESGVRKIAMAPDGGMYIPDEAGNLRVGPIGSQAIFATHPTRDRDQDLLGVSRDGTAWVRDSKNVLYAVRQGRYMEARFPAGQIAISVLDRTGGELWAGTRNGVLFRKKSVGWEEVSPRMPLANAGVTLMAEDPSGAIYIGTRNGLARWRNGAWQTWSKQKGLPSNLISALWSGLNGVAWVGTAAGIVRVEGDQLRVIDKSSGLPDDAITALVQDREGDLWVGTNAGILRLGRAQLDRLAQTKGALVSPEQFNAKDGLRVPEGRPFVGSWLGTDDSVWIVLTRGLAKIKLSNFSGTGQPPETSIQGVLVDGRPVSPQNLVVPATASRVEFQFTALSLLRPERNRFRFQLVGFDKQWVDAGTRRSAVYTGLRGGDYRFEVVGSNLDGVESPAAAAVVFTKTKAFVETPFFVLLLFSAAALFVWLGFQLRVRSLCARHQVTLAERQRIARELHDGLLQEFQGATLKLAALQYSNQDNRIGQQLQEVISGLERSLQESRQAIQSLRGRQWQGVELYPALMECAEDLCREANVKAICQRSFHMIEPPPPIKDAFWQVAREAIRNSLKHGNPTEVKLELTATGDELAMRIVDDGIGFDPAEVRSRPGSRFGLAGLAERAAFVGGRFRLESAPGKGCLVEFRVVL